MASNLRAVSTRRLVVALRDRLIDSLPVPIKIRSFIATGESLSPRISLTSAEVESTHLKKESPKFVQSNHAIWSEMERRNQTLGTTKDAADSEVLKRATALAAEAMEISEAQIRDLETQLSNERASSLTIANKLSELEDNFSNVTITNASKLSETKAKLSEVVEKLDKVELEHNIALDLSLEKQAKLEDIIEKQKKELNTKESVQGGDIPSNKPTVDHELYGRLIHDFGFKKVYATSVHSLLSLPTWQQQRVFRPNRSRKIANDKLKQSEKSNQDIGFPGIVTLFEQTNEDKDTKCGVIDGQHRIGAFDFLFNDGHVSEDQLVLTEVIPVKKTKEIENLFLEINKAEPIKSIDLPGVAGQSERKVIGGATQKLEELHPSMFKTSTRCRVPHVNSDTFRDRCFQADIVNRMNFTKSSELLHWLLQQNEVLSTRSESEWLNTFENSSSFNKRSVGSPTFIKALKKANDNSFFLGLSWEWLTENIKTEKSNKKNKLKEIPIASVEESTPLVA